VPFKRRSEWLLPFEQEANKGKEFIMPITAHEMYNHWTVALGAISKQEASDTHPKRAGGVLVIRYHGKLRGVVGQFQILRDILLEWRIPPKSAPQHAMIGNELALLADSAEPAPPGPFRPSTLGVRHRPKGMNRFLRDLSEQGGVVAILHSRSTCAFLIPLPILARFRHEAKDATPWADSVLNWLYLPDHAPADSGQAEFATAAVL
jgi:hypothetical protein